MKNWEISHYDDTVHMRSDHYSDLFRALKKAHHYSLWRLTIKFLRARGWTITENPYYKKQYACLSQYHKIGQKGNVRILMEITGRGIELKFGDEKNLWKDCVQSFWESRTDDRHTKLSYLEYLAVDLEKKRVTDFFKSKGATVSVNETELLPEERIVHKLKANNHIPGTVHTLQDIKNDIEKDDTNYNWTQNSNDRDKKKIRCGERKYFYDYNGRLSCGTVWHNINNMWWVIYGKILRNVAAFDLFDYTADLHRRKPRYHKSLEKVLEGHVKKQDFLKAHKIQQLILSKSA